MQKPKKILINDLNEYITCKICKGYFIDATTIIECLHTFCRSCIVKCLQTNKYCPVCDVQVHKSKPLLNIRPDKTLQDVVYKLVPRLFQNEIQRKREFYSNHPDAKPSSLEQSIEASYQYLLSPEETVCITLCYHGSESNCRYLRCPAAVSLGHLKKLIRAKYGLKDNHRVDLLYNQDCLNSSLTLMDVTYIYMWKRKGPIKLTYRIYECAVKKLKMESDQDITPPMLEGCVSNNNDWKEVQLRISENGEMSITGIVTNLDSSLLEIVNSEPKYKNDIVTLVQTSSANTNVNSDESKFNISENGYCEIAAISTSDTNKVFDSNEIVTTSDLSSVTLNIPLLGITPSRTLDITNQHASSSSACLSSATTTTVYSTINKTKCSTKTEDTPVKLDQNSVDFQEIGTNITSKSADHDAEKQSEVAQSHQQCTFAPNVSINSTDTPCMKRKSEDVPDNEPTIKQSKQDTTHSHPFLKLSNNHPLKKHSKMNRNGENVRNSFKKITVENDITCLSTSSDVQVDESQVKLVTIDKNLQNTSSTRPSTPVVVSKCIMSTKASIIPQKLPQSTYTSQKPPCYMPKTTAYSQVLNVPKPVTSNINLPTGLKPDKNMQPISTSTKAAISPKADQIPSSISYPAQTHISNAKSIVKTKSTTPIGYKTLRDPPKSWNSQISTANINKSSPEQKYSELKNVRPKFFKMRNNMPRYLGAPASGVKPMYQVNVSPEKEKPPELNKSEKSEIKKHSIVKIDPRTLKPISEKAPEMSNLSNHICSSSALTNNHHSMGPTFTVSSTMNSHAVPNLQTELKINTSSVSIFNPLKLQSSPKNDRKSPKSPQSPKLKTTSSPTTSTNCVTTSKRDKASVTFTPPNPFVPRLASPTTLGPSQFLYPPPPYDPRVMAAAYTSLWYGQRLAGFTGTAGLHHPAMGMDLNSQISQQQRKNFELLAAAHTAQMNSKSNPICNANLSPISRIPNVPVSKQSPVVKKKEIKNEKSLETTLEKLTQNRHKELSSKNDTSEHNTQSGEDMSKSNTIKQSVQKNCPNNISNTEVIGQTCTSNSPSSINNCKSSPKVETNSVDVSEVKVSEKQAIDSSSPSEETPKKPEVREVTDVAEKEKTTNSLPVSREENQDTLRTIASEKKDLELPDSVNTSQCSETKENNDLKMKSVVNSNHISDNTNSDKHVKNGE